jgi:CTP-dependent riboflavin kinase
MSRKVKVIYQSTINGLQKIKEFVYYNQMPFTSRQIVEELGISYKTTNKHIQELVKDSYIKHIGVDKGKNVYIYNKHKGYSTEYRVNQKHYTLESVEETYRRQIKKLREEWIDLL